jgi:hypothetical protein
MATRSQAPSHNNKPKNLLSDWENLIGGQLSLWVGALCLFLAVASLLAITWKTLPPPSPEVRVILGFATSVGLLIAGQKLKQHSQRWFNEGLSGTGLAVGYLSAWAGGPYFQLWPNQIHLFALSFWAIVGGVLAVRNNSRAMLILSAIGGFLTPILLAGNIHSSQSQTPFLFYVLALNTGIVAVATYKSWRDVFYLSYGATLLLLIAWYLGGSVSQIHWLVWTFFTLYFALFLSGILFDAFKRQKPFTENDMAFTYFHVVLYACISTLILELENGFFILGLAAFCALLWKVGTLYCPFNQRLSNTFATLSLLFTIAFVPLQFNSNLVSTMWFSQAVGLAIIARRSNSLLLKKWEFAVWCLGQLALLYLFANKMWKVGLAPSPTDSLALTLLFGLAVTSFLLFWAQKNNERNYPSNVYSAYIIWGGAFFIFREISVWNTATSLKFGESKFYLAASLSLVWSVLAFKFDIKRRWGTIGFNSWLLFIASLSIILCDAIISSQKAFPLFNARQAAFLVGFCAIAVAYQTLTKVNNPIQTNYARTILSSSGLLWLLLGVSIEINNYFSQQNPHYSSLWFVLCPLWAGLGLIGFFTSTLLNEKHLKTLSLGILSATTCVLLWFSLIPAPQLFPLINPRVAAFALIWICIFFPLKSLYSPHIDNDKQPWKFTLSTTLMVLPLWLLTQEVWTGFQMLKASGDTMIFILCAVWASFGCAAFFIAQRLEEKHLKVLALGVLSSATLLLLCISLLPSPVWTPIANIRLLTFGIIGLSLVFTRKFVSDNEEVTNSSLWDWSLITISGTLLLLPLWATTQEIWNGAGAYQTLLGQNYERYASLLISLFWSIYGAVTLYSGVLLKNQNLRLAGLALGALTVLKVYLLDLSFLDGGLRVLSLAGLGASLLFISWLYGRLGRQEKTKFDLTHPL